MHAEGCGPARTGSEELALGWGVAVSGDEEERENHLQVNKETES